MKPVNQTTFGSPGGNCFSACVASILEMPIDDVPYFMGDNPDPDAEFDWWKPFLDWLRPKGYWAQAWQYNEDIDSELGAFHGYHIRCGDTPRGRHCVVALGPDVVHDPGKGDGLDAVSTLIALIPIDPPALGFAIDADSIVATIMSFTLGHILCCDCNTMNEDDSPKVSLCNRCSAFTEIRGLILAAQKEQP